MGTAWARHAMCESALMVLSRGNMEHSHGTMVVHVVGGTDIHMWYIRKTCFQTQNTDVKTFANVIYKPQSDECVCG